MPFPLSLNDIRCKAFNIIAQFYEFIIGWKYQQDKLHKSIIIKRLFLSNKNKIFIFYVIKIKLRAN